MTESPQNQAPEPNVQQPLLEVRNITKRFPGVLALDDMSLQFMPGEVHAVVGENGAGKSTLMKIMAGAYIPDAGEIFLDGRKVSFQHPVDAQLKGISIIYQEFNLLPERTVAHNIFLGREPSKLGVIDVARLNEQAKAVLKEIGVEKMISPSAVVNSLSVAEQQLVEIAKAISLNAKVLIMDEPTAALTYAEVKLLDDLINRLKARGMAIVFISHRLIEVFDIAEKITVMKDGKFVKTVRKDEVKPAEVVYLMVGRTLDHYFPPLGKPEEFSKQIDVLFFSMGSSGDMGSGKSLHQQLTQAGIKHVYYESPGTAHEWLTWRRSLHEFLPLLFQTGPAAQ